MHAYPSFERASRWLAALLFAVCGLAHGQGYQPLVQASTSTWDTELDPIIHSDFERTSNGARASSSVGGSRAGAAASAAAGSLHAHTVTEAGGYGYRYASASALLVDYFWFTSGYGETAYLDWSFQGNVTRTAGPLERTGTGSFGINLEDRYQYLLGLGHHTLYAEPYLGTPNCGDEPDLGQVPDCSYGSAVSVKGVIPFTIVEGQIYRLLAQLSVGGGYGAHADFGHTALMNLRLPEGVEMSSASNVLFTAPAAAVPEPSSALMATIGAAWLCWRRFPRRWLLSRR